MYAPYVDVTQTPTYPFQLPSANPVSSVYLAFIVSDRSQPCRPSWGSYYTLDQAEPDTRPRRPHRTAPPGRRQCDGLLRRSRQHRARGRVHRSSASSSMPIARLSSATTRPRSTSTSKARRLTTRAANTRRASGDRFDPASVRCATHTAARLADAAGLEQPGSPRPGLAAVRTMLAAHVRLAGVNAMAMDYGSDETAPGAMIGERSKARSTATAGAGAVALAHRRTQGRRSRRLGPRRRDGDARGQRRSPARVHHRRCPRTRRGS